MDAYLTDRDVAYCDSPPALIFGDSPAAIARAAATIHLSGLRIGDQCLVEGAADRIDEQAAASLVWLELDDAPNSDSLALLRRMSRDAAAGRYAAVVAGTAAEIDSLAAAVAEPAVEMIIDADASDRASAIAIAMASGRTPLRLSDVAADKNAARLRQLSDEVSRIASTLARLSSGPAGAPATPPPAVGDDIPAVAVESVRSVIRARRLRARYFSEELFADPAWDMLLDLLQAEISQLRVPVSSLCIAAAVPATTALRWLKTMVRQGLFVRRADPHDGRRVFVELSPPTSNALRRYFAEVGRVSVI
jgi:DNA-binding MarR family transcriptional regulator